jgi:hypothetical protein
MLDQKKRTLKRLGIAGVATAMTTMGIPGIAGAATIAPHVAESSAVGTSAVLVAPGAPTGLTATDAGTYSITLSWSKPTTGGAVQGYNIYEGTSSGGEVLTAPVNGNVLVTGTSTTVSTSGTGTYYFEVTAVNAVGQSPASNEASAAAATVAPSAPTGLTAMPSDGAVSLAWTAPSSGNTPTSYEVFYGTSAGAETTQAPASDVTGTTAYVSPLTNGTAYYFVVKAVNGAGTGPASAAATATPNVGLVPPPPTASAAPNGSGSIKVSWSYPGASEASDNGVTGYNVYEGSASGKESTTPINGITPIPVGTNFVDVPSTNGTTEYFTVKAINSTGMSAASNEVSATAEASIAPSAPTLSATAGYDAATLKWTTPSSSGNSKVTSYTVHIDDTTTSTSSTSTVSTTSTTVSGLTAADTYSFYVTATNADGETSGDSNTVSGIVPDVNSAPGAPVNLNVSTTANGTTPVNTLNWTVPTNAGSSAEPSYDVYMGTPSGTHTYLGSTAAGTTTFADSANLNPSTSYSYYVVAANTFGVSGASNVASITTGDATPGAPTGLTALAVTTDGDVGLSWTPPADQGLGNLTYTVLIDGSSTHPSGVTVTPGGTSTAPTATVTGLSSSTQYSFTVEANSAATSGGTVVASSGPSNAVSVTPTAPSAPGGPTSVTATSGGPTSVDVTWAAPATGTATSYTVSYKLTSAGAYTVAASGLTGTSFTVTNLTDGDTYDFTVTAYDQAVAGGTTSSSVPATPGPTAPGAPTALKAVDDGNLVHLSWTAPSNDGGASISGYEVYESQTTFNAGSTPLSGEVLVSGTSAYINGLTPGTPVDLYVKAVNSASLTKIIK